MLFKIECWKLSIADIQNMAQRKKNCTIVYIDGTVIYDRDMGLRSNFEWQHRKAVLLARDIGVELSEKVKFDYPDLFVAANNAPSACDPVEEVEIEAKGLWG